MMNNQSQSNINTDLVLIGGGHSHAIVLKQFGMNPIPGVRLTLVTDVSHTPYSGMLPGYVAGLYSFDECHIDLRPLCQFAQAQMVQSRATGLDLEKNQVLFADRPPLSFDWLSIDIGSTPAATTIPGAAEYTIPVKPISKFLTTWDQLVQAVTKHPDRPVRMAIVGGGAGGVELTLAVQAHLQRIYQEAQQPESNLELHLFQRSDRLLPERNRWAGDRLLRILQERGVQVHLGEQVCAVKDGNWESGIGNRESGIGNWGSGAGLRNVDQAQNRPSSHPSLPTPHSSLLTVHCQSGLTVPCNHVFWVTQASAASWLRESGLATDDRGFVQITNTLQSVSHPQVFAAGDVATMVNHPRPKAGVFAVRQGKPLYNNLRRALLSQPLQPFVPQKQFLILIGTGDRSALASRGWFHFGSHRWIWNWKDRIDRAFMEKFSDLKSMGGVGGRGSGAGKQSELGDRQSWNQSSPLLPTPHSPLPVMHCAGCGSKVGSSVLEQVLKRIQQEQPDRVSRSDILIGLEAADDAAVVTVPSGQVMVQTIDQFRSLIDDPYVFGQICANHCLSDIYAMGATPQSALAIATIPYGTEAKQAETLYQLMSGAMKVLTQAGAELMGGHTTEGAELSFGLTCNGLAEADRLWRKGGMQAGQALLLTKPLGTGTLFAANMQLQAKGRWIEAAVRSMVQSNQEAATCLWKCGATACTDVTGFGLLGHLMEMVRASHAAVELDLTELPILDGAKETTQQGIHSSLYPQNLKVGRSIINASTVQHHPLYPLLFDPQTSGGLLASIPADRAVECLMALKKAGYTDSKIIGTVHTIGTEPSVRVKT
jgi:selenide,water dikinase